MPEYSSTTITPADGVQVPSMNGSTSGNFLLSALRDYILASKGQANGLASLGSDGKLTASQLPDLADDVIVVASYAVLPATGTAGKIYITADNNKMYRWDSDEADYVELSVDLSEYAKLTDLAAEESAREAADANLNNAITAIDHRVQNLEQAKGSYVVQNYKDGSITPSGKGAWAIVEGLRGVSRVENGQLGPTLHAGSMNNGITPSYDASTQTMGLSGTSTGSFDAILIDAVPILTPGHTYLVAIEKSATGFTFTDNYQALSNTASYVFTAGNQNPYFNIRARGNAGVTPNYEGRIGLTDLNIYFGTSDLSFLGATDSAKLATIQQNYPQLLIPSDYGVRIVDSSYSGVRAVGVNIWDEETESGRLDNSGAEVVSASYIRAKNYINVLPSTTYYVKTPYAIRYYFYDMNHIFVGGAEYAVNQSFTSPSNAVYMRFYIIDTYGTTYNHDIQICLNSYTDKTTYHPYMESTLSLTFTGKSAGSVYDSCEPNVEVEGVAKKRTTQRIATVDCTTLTWTYNSVRDWWSAPYTSGVPFTNQPKNCLYKVGLSSDFAHMNGNSTLGYFMNDSGWSNVQEIYIRNGSSTTPPDGLFYYEAPTPTVTLSDPLIDNTLLTEAGGRMATVQTGTVVDGSFDMGFINL